MAWSLRRPDASDAEALTAVVQAGFESYRSFAPETWEPPDEYAIIDRSRAELADPEAFSLAAWDGGEVVAHVRWVPLGDPVDVHLRYLFVLESHWGTGIARELHSAAIEALDGRSARLFTPAQQARARRFYEREGWRLHSEAPEAPAFGIPVVEYRFA